MVTVFIKFWGNPSYSCMSWKKKTVTISGFCLNAHICLIELLESELCQYLPFRPRSFYAFLWTSTSSRFIKNAWKKKKKKKKRAAVNIQPFWPNAWSLTHICLFATTWSYIAESKSLTLFKKRVSVKTNTWEFPTIIILASLNASIVVKRLRKIKTVSDVRYTPFTFTHG